MDTLFDILRALYKHRYELLIVPVFTMGLVYYLTDDTPKVYKTEAKLYLNLQEGKGTSLSDEDLKQFQIQSYFTNTIELLKAERTIERVKLKAIERALEKNNFFAIYNESLVENETAVRERIEVLTVTGNRLESARFPDSLMIRFLNKHGLTTSRMKDMIMSYRLMDSNFMKFELTDNIAEKAQLMATLFIEALSEENRELAKSKIKGHKDIIEGLVRQAKADLDAKIRKLEEYKVRNNIINLGEHTKAIVVYLVQLEGQRANLMADVAAGQKGKSEVLATVSRGNVLLNDVSTNSEILQLKQQLRSLNRQMLLTAFEKNEVASPAVLRDNIESTRAQIEGKLAELSRKTPYDPSRVQLDLVSKYLGYDLDASTSSDMINIINEEIARVTKYAKRFAPFESTIGSYEQEISTAENAYLVLLNKLNLTQSLEFGSGENVVEVIDPPYLPSKPEASKRMILVVAAGLAVFVLMSAVFVVIQLLDASVRTISEFEKQSRLPVVAGVPSTLLSKQQAHLTQSVTFIHRQQVFKLMQEIVTRCIGEHGILMLTSSRAGEGKHYVAGVLYDLLNRSGKNVAFIDADWMSPHENENFINFKSIVSEQGLITNRETVINKLTEIKNNHDLTVVIASPMNLSSEAGFWTEVSQHLLYIFKANRLITKADRRVEQMLLNTRLQFLGTVINGLDIENMEDYLGEIPRKRNPVRIFIKKLLTRNFE